MTELSKKIEVIKELSAMFDEIDFNLVFNNNNDRYVNIDNNISSREEAQQLFQLIDYLTSTASKIEVVNISTYYYYKGVGFYIDDKGIKKANYIIKLYS